MVWVINMINMIKRNKLIFIIFLLIGFSVPSILNSQIKENELTSEQKLKAQIFQLKLQLTQCTTNLNNNILMNEQVNLITDFRKKLNAGNDQEFDWNTLKFLEPTKSDKPKELEDKK